MIDEFYEKNSKLEIKHNNNRYLAKRNKLNSFTEQHYKSNVNESFSPIQGSLVLS